MKKRLAPVTVALILAAGAAAADTATMSSLPGRAF